MLKREIIIANPILSTLTEDQIKAIESLSSNDENAAIAVKTREIWDSVDADIKAVTGEDKPTNTKSYDHLKSVLGGFKEKAANSIELEKQIGVLKTEKTNLEKTIKEGGNDSALKAELKKLEQSIADKESTIEKLRNDFTVKENEFAGKIKAEEQKNIDLKFDTNFATALQGVKFKANIPQVAIDAVISAAKATAKTKGTPEFQSIDGKEKIIFRDQNNMIITNPKNLQNPLTADELFLEAISEVIDSGKAQKGAGSGAGGGEGGGSTFTLSASNKVEADRQIREHLNTEGIKPGTAAFQEKYSEIYNESKVSELPSR